MTDRRREYFNDDQIAEMDAGFPTRRHMAESPPLPRSEGAAPTTETKIEETDGTDAVLEVAEWLECDGYSSAATKLRQAVAHIRREFREFAAPNSPKNSDGSPAAASLPSERETAPVWFCNKCGRVGEAASREAASEQHRAKSPDCHYFPSWNWKPPAHIAEQSRKMVEEMLAVPSPESAPPSPNPSETPNGSPTPTELPTDPKLGVGPPHPKQGTDAPSRPDVKAEESRVGTINGETTCRSEEASTASASAAKHSEPPCAESRTIAAAPNASAVQPSAETSATALSRSFASAATAGTSCTSPTSANRSTTPPEPPPGTTDAQPEDVAGLLARMDKMADDDSGLLDGEVRTIREAATALRAATDRAEKAEAELTRIGNVPWRDKHALATAGNIEAHLRRKLREAESRHATAIERVKQLPRYRPEIGWSQWSQSKFGMGHEYPYAEESDEGNFIDRAAVLSILTGEPDTHA